jgi:gluconokinase
MGIDTSINFCIGSSDGCLAVIGSGALGSGKAGLTIGTSGAIRLLNPIPVYHYPEMIFNYLLEDGMFICGGPVNNGGNTVQWLLKTFWDKTKVTQDDYRQLFKYIEEIATGSNGLLFLPYIHGERSPIWDEKASGVFVGIRPEHTKAHFSKAVLEGICFGLNMVLELLNESIPIEQINVSGGFTHAPGWLQLLSDISGKRLCLPHNEDASALGAAFIGMKSAGWIKDYNISVQSDAPIIEPDMENYSKYKDLFEIFKSLYGNLNGTMHQLYDLNK